MKSVLAPVLAIMSFFIATSVAQADLNGFASVSCRYKEAGKTKKPVVTLSTVYSGDNFEPKVTLSVAYSNTQGKRVIERAVVADAGYTESYEGYGVGAYTTSGKYFEISIYIADGGNGNGYYDSFITVNGNEQPHMKNLVCTFSTAG